MVIDTDCIGSCKFNYHTITATTGPEMSTPYVGDAGILLLMKGKLTTGKVKLSRLSLSVAFNRPPLSISK